MTARDNIDRAGNDDAVRKALLPDPRPEDADGASRGHAAIDPVTGEVSGAGSGAGGGVAGEDFDDDHTSGSNTVR